MGNGITYDDYVLTANINTVTYLNVTSSGIIDLTGIEDFTELTDLSSAGGHLEIINLSNNTKLISLRIALNSNLTSLDISQNTALTSLSCDSNNLSSLDVSNNTALTFLLCYNNNITSLDLTNNTELTYLYCGTNNLNSLDAKNGYNTNFSYFNANFNPDLYCINLDNEIYSTANWSSNIDAQSYFNEDCAALGLNDELLAKSITLYPNPVSEILIIDSTIPLTRVEIFSLLGQKVKDINSHFNSINVSNLSKGVYIVKLQSENGFTTKKIIKK